MKISERFSIYRNLPGSVYALSIARVINSTGNFVLPFLTLYLTEKAHFTTQFAGFIVTLSSLAGGSGMILEGKLADHFGRKKIFILMNLACAFIFSVCLLYKNNQIIPWLIALANFFIIGSWPLQNAIVADLTGPSNRKAAFSLTYLGNNLGFAIGTMIAGYLFNNHIAWLFIGNIIANLLSVALIIFYVPETLPAKGNLPMPGKSLSGLEKSQSGNSFILLIKRPELVWFSLVTVIYYFIFTQQLFSLPLYLNELFGKKGPGFYGMVMSTNGLVIVAATIFITALTHRIKPILNITASGVFYATGLGLLYFARSLPVFIACAVIWTFGEILGVTNTNVFINSHTPVSHRGRFNGIISFITGTGYSLSPLIMGIYIRYHSIRSVWAVMFFLGIFSAILMYGLYFYEKEKNKSPKPLI